MTLSVRGSRELQAVVLAVKRADRTLARDIARATRTTMNPVWQAEVRRRTRTPLEARVYGRGTRIAGGNPPTAMAATSTRRTTGGLVPSQDWTAVEFGGDQNKVTTYTRRNPGGSGTHKVTRHASRQLKPRRPRGYVAFPAMKELGPRLASLWVQLTVRKFADAFDGKG